MEETSSTYLNIYLWSMTHPFHTGISHHWVQALTALGNLWDVLKKGFALGPNAPIIITRSWWKLNATLTEISLVTLRRQIKMIRNDGKCYDQSQSWSSTISELVTLFGRHFFLSQAMYFHFMTIQMPNYQWSIQLLGHFYFLVLTYNQGWWTIWQKMHPFRHYNPLNVHHSYVIFCKVLTPWS